MMELCHLQQEQLTGMNREKARTGNMRLASCGVTCLHSSSVFQLGFCAGLTVWCSETPHERQAQKRCAAAY